ncbi:DUF3302 domain-containing protein [Polycladidibacter hongkongensis]|uniref:DUF3302 domain-containing protein n=1 Tax=Polycladidibacter hongkongensis TaxID=1647556 RepID=UPI00082BCD32|nr:DUF3302 domain-containing protein [Pseudovibrio hongkongensis]
MFDALSWVALALIFFVFLVFVYGIVYIHDIPAQIAERRHHPHADAIHAAGWVSLFTLHALWPFLWVWAMAYRPERGFGFGLSSPKHDPLLSEKLLELQEKVAALELQKQSTDEREGGQN